MDKLPVVARVMQLQNLRTTHNQVTFSQIESGMLRFQIHGRLPFHDAVNAMCDGRQSQLFRFEMVRVLEME